MLNYLVVYGDNRSKAYFEERWAAVEFYKLMHSRGLTDTTFAQLAVEFETPKTSTL